MAEADFFTAGTATGSVSGPPPPVSEKLMQTITESSRKESTGQNMAGKDQAGNEEGQTEMGMSGKPKTAKESTDDPKPPPAMP